MFALNRRHWFAGITALALSTRLRGTAATPEPPMMPDPHALPAAAADDPFTDVPNHDLFFGVEEIVRDHGAYWLRPLDDLKTFASPALARECAQVRQALDRLIDLAPERLAHSREYLDVDRALAEVESTAWDTALVLGYALGQRGAPAIVYTDAVTCFECYGAGRLWNGQATRPAGVAAAAATICPACDGQGYREQAAVALFHPKRRGLAGLAA